jgi:hypothetical protein
MLLSLCLVTFIPGGLKFASTWRQLAFYQVAGFRVQNFLMPMGLFSLGFVTIGLTVLWTGYRKAERWAWFVMLIILLCFVFPSNALPVLLQMRGDNHRWSDLLDLSGAFRETGWWHCLAIAFSGLESIGIECMAVWMVLGILVFLAMLIALLLPIKAFFWKSHVPNTGDEHNEQDAPAPGDSQLTQTVLE